jgi:YVTN family beta-propeller protein
VITILVLVAIAAIAVSIYLLTRPATVTITATQPDAMILFDGSVAGTGTLEVTDLKRGRYSVYVERTGFETVSTAIEVRQGRRERLSYDLAPLPQQVIVVTHPEGASVTLSRDDAVEHQGPSPVSVQLPSGLYTLTIDLPGYNTFTREMSIDTTTTLEYHLDPEGQVLHGLGLITTLGAPKGVSVTHDGSEAWTSILNGPPSIQIFDPQTGEILGGVDIGEYGAVEVIFNRSGTLAYTSQMETAKCFEIDVATRTVLREFDTGSAWTKWVELSPDEKTLYASNWSGGDVSIIDLETGDLVKRVGVSNTPRGMYATEDGRYLYVAGFDSGHLERIDLDSGVVATLFTGGGALRHIVADETTGRLFISDMADDLIWVHDMATGSTTKFVDTDEKPNTIDLTPDGKMLFVSCRGENNEKTYYLPGPEWGSILVFDTADGRPLDALIAGNQPTALDVSDDGSLLVFSDFLDNRLRVYEIPGYDTFAAAGGGRYDEHFAEIAK